MTKRTAESVYNHLLARIIYYTRRDGGMYCDVITQFFMMCDNYLSTKETYKLYDLYTNNKSIKIKREKAYYDSSGMFRHGRAFIC